MSVYWSILSEVQDQLRNRVELPSHANIPQITREAIVIRPCPTGEDSKDWLANEKKPGIVISPGKTIRIPPEGGNSCNDDVYYPVLIQLIDSDQDRSNENRLQAWLIWLEAIRKYFSCGNLRNEVFSTPGYVDLALMSQVDLLNSKMFTISRFAMFYLGLEVISREPHSTNGRV